MTHVIATLVIAPSAAFSKAATSSASLNIALVAGSASGRRAWPSALSTPTWVQGALPSVSIALGVIVITTLIAPVLITRARHPIGVAAGWTAFVLLGLAATIIGIQEVAAMTAAQ